GEIANFPYRDCTTARGAYSLAPDVASLGGGKYCFTIQVDQGCSGPCCSTDLQKIEFDVSSSCLVSGASVIATINGKRTQIGASFDKPEMGPPGTAILRIPQLGLNKTTAQNAELCITLKPNNAGRGCTTLEQLCSTPSGGCPGACSAAFFDTPCKCCPISNTRGRSCTPLPPPDPPVFCTSQVCYIAELEPPTPDVRPYRFDDATCTSLKVQLGKASQAINVGSDTLASYLDLVLRVCEGTRVVMCSNFTESNVTDAAWKTAFAGANTELVTFFLSLISGPTCLPELDGYTIRTRANSEKCVLFDEERSIPCVPPPGVNCSCDVKQGVLPFVVGARYAPAASLPPSKVPTTDYCFTISTTTNIAPSNCTSISTIGKVELIADPSLRAFVRGFTLYLNNGTSTKISPTWGSNTLRATNLLWSVAEADGARVCVTLRNPVTMIDICQGTRCTVSVFNEDKDCCPLFYSGPV
ncbi:extracellular matrix glycoprotein pherophorin-V8, partial [Volvox carteri f. nagariensis]